MPFTIVRQDITKMKVDAIVNAANTALQRGGGVCGAIFRAAGAGQLQDACNQLAPIETGGAVITPGFNLPAKYIIHTAGPRYAPWKQDLCRQQLRSAYLESLKLALANDCESIAFPLISSGIYGYPKDKALEVARLAIAQFLQEHEMDVYLAVFDKSSFLASKALLSSVKSYIDEHYLDGYEMPGGRRIVHAEDRAFMAGETSSGFTQSPASPEAAPEPAQQACEPPPPRPRASAPPPQASSVQPPLASALSGLDELMLRLDEPFSDTLLKLIDQKGKTDVEVYKRANIDRKLFSKIRNGKGYTPKKPTILALAIALELTLPETDSLLERAGYALSHASKFDVIVEYFIINRKYNILEINEVLFAYDQPLLGCC